jgi:hypothetical protein
MEDDVSLVVVTLRADGLADELVVLAMMGETGERNPMAAPLGRRPGMARTCPGLGPGMHRPK